MLLRVMTYNLYFGGAGRLDAIHAVVAHERPDTITFTEADDQRVVVELAGRLGMEHVWAKGSGDRHIALLSRFPIREWRIYNRPPLTQAVLATKLLISDLHSPITLYSLHLLPFLLFPFELQRARALRALLKIIRRAPPGPHLILGDVNAIAPGDRVLQHKNPARMRRVMALQANLIFRWAIPVLLRAGYVDCYRATHPHSWEHPERRPAGAQAKPALSLAEGDAAEADGFTWWTTNRTTRYDYIFADPWFAARLRACRVADDLAEARSASDHFPVIADFDL